jgi:murein DD-endopeptidase MepM/ murein hydrolase activator NlpD
MRRRSLFAAIGIAFCVGALVATAALRIPVPARHSAGTPVAAEEPLETPAGDLPRGPVHERIRERAAERAPGPAGEVVSPSTGSSEAEEDTSGSKGTSGVETGEAERVLRDRALLLPVEGVEARNLVDTFQAARGAGQHEALDILAPRHTPVRAVDDGRVVRLFTSKRGGLTVYQFDRTERYCYYYAHLDAYADGVAEGDAVKRGDVLGYVGTTGNAPPGTPHLHFAVFVLGADKHWWEGTAIDPLPLFKD